MFGIRISWTWLRLWLRRSAGEMRLAFAIVLRLSSFMMVVAVGAAIIMRMSRGVMERGVVRMTRAVRGLRRHRPSVKSRLICCFIRETRMYPSQTTHPRVLLLSSLSLARLRHHKYTPQSHPQNSQTPTPPSAIGKKKKMESLLNPEPQHNCRRHQWRHQWRHLCRPHLHRPHLHHHRRRRRRRRRHQSHRLV